MRDDDKSVQKMFASTEKGNFDTAILEGEKSNCSGVQVLLAGLREREHGLTEGMEIAAGKCIERMKQGMKESRISKTKQNLHRAWLQF